MPDSSTATASGDTAGDVPEFGWEGTEPIFTAAYLGPAIEKLLPDLPDGARVLDIGCGNGWWLGQFQQRGCTVVGVDASEEGIAIARRTYPDGRFYQTLAGEDLLERIDEAPFDLVLSTEVVEHVYSPQEWAAGCLAALRPGGRLICSTPYHGYVKNLALALAGKWDRHLTALTEGGHIKFFSRDTLGRLLTDAGFRNIRFVGAGRLPLLWKSMVMSGDRPE